MQHTMKWQSSLCLYRNKLDYPFMMSESVRPIRVVYKSKKHFLTQRSLETDGFLPLNVPGWHSHTFRSYPGSNNRAHDRLITPWWPKTQLQCFSAYHKGNGAVFGPSRVCGSLWWIVTSWMQKYAGMTGYSITGCLLVRAYEGGLK